MYLIILIFFFYKSSETLDAFTRNSNFFLDGGSTKFIAYKHQAAFLKNNILQNYSICPILKKNFEPTRSKQCQNVSTSISVEKLS